MNQPKDSEMSKLLDDKQYFNLPKKGELVKGKVISALKNEIHIDLDGIHTGIVRGRESYNEAEEYRNLKAGDEVEATVMELENENGEIELSFRYAGRQKAWQTIKDYQKEEKIVKAAITDANKGGLMIKVDTTAGFLPVSQLAPEHYPRVPGGDKNHILEILKGYIGKSFDVKVLDFNEDEEKLIVSEKAAWEETQKDVMNKYKIGSIVDGRVTAVTDFGVFVEFSDKLEGLVHISEIAWQRIDDPHDFVKVGEKVKTEIIGIEGSKIFLSIKKLLADPWQNVSVKYQIGQKVDGKVIKSNPFGLFVELDKDIHGLAHISQLSHKPVRDAGEIAKAGDTLDFYIISIEPEKHRLGLSLLPPKEKPAETKTEKEKKKKEDPTIDKPEAPETTETAIPVSKPENQEVTETAKKPAAEIAETGAKQITEAETKTGKAKKTEKKEKKPRKKKE